ncbi:MAG: TetR/AcrR family transcriptional regulator [Acidimicrobiales bacterium]
MILDAAIELLLGGGARDVTATRVAEKTGVARTTIYRHWPDQPSLLLATVDLLVAPHAVAAHSGDLHVDLTTALSRLRNRLETRQVRPVFAALLDYAARDEAFVAAQRRFIEGMMQPTIDVLSDAKRRGELPATIDCSVAANVLTSPLFQQFLLLQKTIEDDLIDEVIAQFMQSRLRAAP